MPNPPDSSIELSSLATNLHPLSRAAIRRVERYLAEGHWSAAVEAAISLVNIETHNIAMRIMAATILLAATRSGCFSRRPFFDVDYMGLLHADIHIANDLATIINHCFPRVTRVNVLIRLREDSPIPHDEALDELHERLLYAAQTLRDVLSGKDYSAILADAQMMTDNERSQLAPRAIIVYYWKRLAQWGRVEEDNRRQMHPIPLILVILLSVLIIIIFSPFFSLAAIRNVIDLLLIKSNLLN